MLYKTFDLFVTFLKPGFLEIALKGAPSSFQGLRIVATSDAKSMKQKVRHVFNNC